MGPPLTCACVTGLASQSSFLLEPYEVLHQMLLMLFCTCALWALYPDCASAGELAQFPQTAQIGRVGGVDAHTDLAHML